MKNNILHLCNWRKGLLGKKCDGEVIRIKKKGKNWVEGMEGVEYIDYCNKCNGIHMLWNKGELKNEK